MPLEGSRNILFIADMPVSLRPKAMMQSLSPNISVSSPSTPIYTVFLSQTTDGTCSPDIYDGLARTLITSSLSSRSAPGDPCRYSSLFAIPRPPYSAAGQPLLPRSDSSASTLRASISREDAKFRLPCLRWLHKAASCGQIQH